jgi:hypothetical protein
MQAIEVDYTQSDVDLPEGGEVVFAALSTPPIGSTVEIERHLDYSRITGYMQNGDFRPETVDRDQDYQTALLQQLEFTLRRVLLFPSDAAADDMQLPARALRKSKLLGFDVNGKFTLFDSAYSIVVQQGSAEAATLVFADAASGPVNVDLPASGEVVITKTDNSSNPVTINATGGATVVRQALIQLTTQDESIRLYLNNNNWSSI